MTKIKPFQIDEFNNPVYYDPDTMAIRQLSQQAQFSAQYSFKDKQEKKQSLQLQFGFQESKERHTNVQSQYFHGNVQYSCFIFQEYLLSSSLQSSGQISEKKRDRISLGPGIQIGKAYFEKTLQCQFGLQYFYAFQDKNRYSHIAGIHLRGEYLLKQQHLFTLSFHSQLRFLTTLENRKTNSDLFLQLSYRYTFKLL